MLWIKSLYLLMALHSGGLPLYVGVYLNQALAVPTQLVGLLNAVGPLMGFLVAPWWTRHWADRRGAHKCLLAFLPAAHALVFVVGLYVLPAAFSGEWPALDAVFPPGTRAAIPIAALFFVFALAAALLSSISPTLDATTIAMLPNKQDFGKQRLFAGIGFGITSFVTGSIAQQFGAGAMFLYHCGVALFIMAVVSAFAPMPWTGFHGGRVPNNPQQAANEAAAPAAASAATPSPTSPLAAAAVAAGSAPQAVPVHPAYHHASVGEQLSTSLLPSCNASVLGHERARTTAEADEAVSRSPLISPTAPLLAAAGEALAEEGAAATHAPADGPDAVSVVDETSPLLLGSPTGTIDYATRARDVEVPIPAPTTSDVVPSVAEDAAAVLAVTAPAQQAGTWAMLLSRPEHLLFLLMLFLSGTVFATIAVFLWLHLAETGVAPVWLGMTTLFQVALELPIFHDAPRIFRALGTTRMMLISHAALVVRCIAYPLLPLPVGGVPPAWLYAVEAMHGIAFALHNSATVEWARVHAPPGMDAAMQALAQGVYASLGAVAGNVGMGAVYARAGAAGCFYACAGIAVVSAAVLLLSAALDRKAGAKGLREYARVQHGGGGGGGGGDGPAGPNSPAAGGNARVAPAADDGRRACTRQDSALDAHSVDEQAKSRACPA